MSNVKKEGQAQLFQNSFLEIFTKTNPVIHVITYGTVVLFFLGMNAQNIPRTLVMFGGGVFIWTLMEYLMHRYLFHINSPKFQYMIHGVHHEYPRDKERLLMPPVPGITIVIILFGFFYLFLYQYNYAFMAGLITGYMIYTFVHYIVHTWKPVKVFRFLWTHHHKHHNPAYENKAFGVSSPFWDYIFGTMPPGNKHKQGHH